MNSAGDEAAAARRRAWTRWPARFALAVGALLLVALMAEAGLRAAGFSFDLAPERVEFGWPDPEVIEKLYTADPDLFWVRYDYQPLLETQRGKRLDLAFLGDSCTEFGRYPEEFGQLLRARWPRARIAWKRFGTGGWSSFQGLRQLERDVLPLGPRVATLYFGWNDHWLGFGVEDAEIGGFGRGALGSSRLAQLVFRARLGSKLRSGARPLRVPLEDFRANLARAAELARASGTVPVLLTAPTSLEVGRVPPKLAERLTNDLDTVVPLHAAYAQAVRDVAAERGAVLCDLAARFDALDIEVRRASFGEDAIHATPEGDRRIAEFLLDCFDADAELRGILREPALR